MLILSNAFLKRFGIIPLAIQEEQNNIYIYTQKHLDKFNKENVTHGFVIIFYTIRKVTSMNSSRVNHIYYASVCLELDLLYQQHRGLRTTFKSIAKDLSSTF